MFGEWGRGITPPFSASPRPGCLGRGREHPGLSSVMVHLVVPAPWHRASETRRSSGMASPCSRRPIWGCSVADCRRQRWARDVLNFVVYPDRLTRPPARSPSHRGRPAGFHRTWFSMPSAGPGIILWVARRPPPEHSSMCCVLAAEAGQNTAH